jgi:hypothetical protein
MRESAQRVHRSRWNHPSLGRLYRSSRSEFREASRAGPTQDFTVTAISACHRRADIGEWRIKKMQKEGRRSAERKPKTEGERKRVGSMNGSYDP